MKKTILVTGGAGFVGSNLIKKIINDTSYNVISLDDYSSGSKKNHYLNKRIKYIRGNTINIVKILDKYKKNIFCAFHFGEFARIHQSFFLTNQCFRSNLAGTFEVISFCKNNKIRFIYSATSAALGNKGKDADLSPYAFSKSSNIQLLNNFKKWFNFKFDIIYFYNVYGFDQITKGFMATVIGIFENQYKKKVPLTIVRPGTQKRLFTHIDDTVDACMFVFRQKRYKQYSISFEKSYSIIQIAKFFNFKIKFIPKRKGERYKSSVVQKIKGNKIINIKAKKDIKNYILNFINNS
jgi:UDP-glucose 4-epimerase